MKGLLIVCLLALAAVAAAQEPAVKYARTTTLNFEDDAIDGALQRPDGEVLVARRKVKHSNLIRVRTDFKAKSMQTLVTVGPSVLGVLNVVLMIGLPLASVGSVASTVSGVPVVEPALISCIVGPTVTLTPVYVPAGTDALERNA